MISSIVAARQRLERLRNVVRRYSLMTRALQGILEDQPNCRLVIEAENRCHDAVDLMGALKNRR